jgi:hypothetical protein
MNHSKRSSQSLVGAASLTSKLCGCFSYASLKVSSARCPVRSSFNKAMPRQA